MTSEKIFKCFLKGLAKNTGSHRISLDKTNVANLLIYCKQKKKNSAEMEQRSFQENETIFYQLQVKA